MLDREGPEVPAQDASLFTMMFVRRQLQGWTQGRQLDSPVPVVRPFWDSVFPEKTQCGCLTSPGLPILGPVNVPNHCMNFAAFKVTFLNVYKLHTGATEILGGSDVSFWSGDY